MLHQSSQISDPHSPEEEHPTTASLDNLHAPKSGIISLWRCLEERFSQNDYNGPAHGAPFSYSFGPSRLALTSVHSVNHYNSQLAGKHADHGTGGLVSLLGELYPQVSIFCNTRTDLLICPYPDRETGADLFVRALARTMPAPIVIDVHAMEIWDRHGPSEGAYAGAIGCARYPASREQSALIEIVREAFSEEELELLHHPQRYNARNEGTVTYRSSHVHGVKHALQLEIAWPYLAAFGSDENAERLLRAFRRVCERLIELPPSSSRLALDAEGSKTPLPINEPQTALSKRERLGIFISRLKNSQPAFDFDDAFELLSDVLNGVEDEFTNIPYDSVSAFSRVTDGDGRMYAPRPDNIVPVPDVPGMMRLISKGNDTYIASNGAIGIYMRTKEGRRQLLSKPGQDGAIVEDFLHVQ